VPLCNGIRYFESRPAGDTFPPVLMLHGAGANHLAWPGTLRRLPGLRVISPDLPGHGDSRINACASIHAYAERLLEFLDDLGAFHMGLAGHSMGAFVALDMARLAPDQVTCLALLSAGLSPPSAPRISRLIDQPVEPEMVRQVLLETFFSPFTSLPDREKALGRFGGQQAHRFLLDWRLCQNHETAPDANPPSVPALVVSGAEDGVVKPSASRALAIAGKDWQFVQIEHAGHMLIQESADVLAPLLAQFFKNCFAPLHSPDATRPLSNRTIRGPSG
jgi:pimeloyl-ACP methyl ester carboxylesterase